MAQRHLAECLRDVPLQAPWPMSSKRLLTSPSGLMLLAILAGVGFGWLSPVHALKLRFIGDYFVDAVRLFVGPVIFCTVALGIAALRGSGELSSASIKAFCYFEAMSLFSLLAGIAGALILRPGAGLHLPGAVSAPTPALSQALHHTVTGSLALQLLAAGVVCGLLLAHRASWSKAVLPRLQAANAALLAIIRLLLKAAPLAAFAAVALTVGKYGLTSMGPLLALLGALYATTTLFVVLVLGAVAHLCGFSLWRLILFIREELLLVFGTAASVASIAPLIDKLTRLGCPAALTQVVLPAGFSFNLNGSSIYLSLTLLFLAQAAGQAVTLDQLTTIVAVAMLASKGASGIAGSSFVILGSLTLLVPGIAPESLVLVFSLERLLKCRSLANVTGNAVGCIAILCWMGRMDRARMRTVLDGEA